MIDGFDDVPTDLGTGLQWAIKVLIAVFLFGVALDTRPRDFREVLRRPSVFAVLLLTQYVVLPALTLGLIVALDPAPTVALGMVFVICCPSGSLSNLITHRAGGDVALSVSLTLASNAVALVATPLAFAFWGSRLATTDALLTSVHLDAADLAIEMALLIGLPFALGVGVALRWPDAAARMRRPFEIGTLVLLLAVILGGLAGRAPQLARHLDAVVVAVVVQNALSFLVGYGAGRASRLPPAGVRTMTIELGMRNTGLALVLVLAYFNDFGGTILLVAAWAVWDVVVGLGLAAVWRRQPLPVTQPEGQSRRSPT